MRTGALPGKAIVIYEPARNLMVDLFPSEDGHAQARALLPAVVETVQWSAVWVGDRNFCVTDFLVGIAARGASFIIREHEQLRFTPQKAMGYCGRVETGAVAERRATGDAHPHRRAMGLPDQARHIMPRGIFDAMPQPPPALIPALPAPCAQTWPYTSHN